MKTHSKPKVRNAKLGLSAIMWAIIDTHKLVVVNTIQYTNITINLLTTVVIIEGINKHVN